MTAQAGLFWPGRKPKLLALSCKGSNVILLEIIVDVFDNVIPSQAPLRKHLRLHIIFHILADFDCILDLSHSFFIICAFCLCIMIMSMSR